MGLATVDDCLLLLDAAPLPYLILAPDAAYTIVAASHRYLSATGTRRENLIGRGLFEVFPPDLDGPAAAGIHDLRRSLQKVVAEGVADVMAIYEYEIPRAGHEPGETEFELRYWRPTNTPVLNDAGQVRFVIHHIDDLTDATRSNDYLTRQYADQSRKMTAHSKRLRAEIAQYAELAREANRQLESTLETLEQREAELAQLRQRYNELRRGKQSNDHLAQSVMDNISEGAFVADASMRILSVNRAFTEITGYTAAETIGQQPLFLRAKRTPPGTYASIWDALSSSGSWNGELWNRRKSGELFLERLTINAIAGNEHQAQRFVGVFSDITELRRKDDYLQHLAFFDALTDLPNRLLLQDRLQHALERAGRERGRLAVLFIDLDRFKAVNDMLGHEVGDTVLQNVAKRLKAHLRSMDTVARLGGDEFVVVLEEIEDVRDCASVARNIIAALDKPLQFDDRVMSVGASVGIAIFPEDGATAAELIRRADAAMYTAKSIGGNCYHFADPAAAAKADDIHAAEASCEEDELRPG